MRLDVPGAVVDESLFTSEATPVEKAVGARVVASSLNMNGILQVEATRIVKQNLAWAFLYNSIGIRLAVAGMLNPFMAAIAMLASSISVVLNSMRLSYPKGLLRQRVVEILSPWIEREPTDTLEVPAS
ncbi:MAG: hypothetical protein C4326_09025 [Ignavibacteria bacterium]